MEEPLWFGYIDGWEDLNWKEEKKRGDKIENVLRVWESKENENYEEEISQWVWENGNGREKEMNVRFK